jgi:type IV pilus assembly protein PilA
MRREKMNNKGFSLVELIIVIAIMAILSAALAPQLMKYIEKSRVSTDASSCSSIESCVNAALAEEEIYKEVAAQGADYGVILMIAVPEDKNLEASHITSSKTTPRLQAELASTLASLKAPKQTGKVSYVVEIDTKQVAADASLGGGNVTEVGKIACFTYTKNDKVPTAFTKLKDVSGN